MSELDKFKDDDGLIPTLQIKISNDIMLLHNEKVTKVKR